MRRARPQGQVAENLFDHGRLFNEGDDPHGSGASGTHARIDFVHLLDEASTSSAEHHVHARLAAEAGNSVNCPDPRNSPRLFQAGAFPFFHSVR